MNDWELRQRQSLPLEAKIILTQRRIREWYEAWEGEVYVSFSGGKDSTVLLHLVRELYPEVPAMFIDTGLEYPEIKAFVQTIKNVVIVKPKMLFYEVVQKYGFPIVSKETAERIYRLRHYNLSDRVKKYYLEGDREKGFPPKLAKKWRSLLTAPFEVNSYCCNVLKKAPGKKYAKETGRKLMTGEMADDSRLRRQQYLGSGCNAYEAKKPKSMPLAFWKEQEILQYIKVTNLPYSAIYGDIIELNGKLGTTGESRTGCMFCGFGVHLEKGENRFQRMASTHPKQYDYCINKLGLGEVLDYIGVDYKRDNLFDEVGS